MPTDLTVAEHYAAYSSAVRACLLENRSLQQVEAARAAAKAAITRAQAE